jgi:hypothetical protein
MEQLEQSLRIRSMTTRPSEPDAAIDAFEAWLRSSTKPQAESE